MYVMGLEFLIRWLSYAFAIMGAFVMVSSGVVTLYRFLKYHPWSIEGSELRYVEKIRLALGHKLIFALEFLIIADVLRTLINPTMDELIELGGIVLIRTVLSFFISRELAEFHREGKA